MINAYDCLPVMNTAQEGIGLNALYRAEWKEC